METTFCFFAWKARNTCCAFGWSITHIFLINKSYRIMNFLCFYKLYLRSDKFQINVKMFIPVLWFYGFLLISKQASFLKCTIKVANQNNIYFRKFAFLLEWLLSFSKVVERIFRQYKPSEYINKWTLGTYILTSCACYLVFSMFSGIVVASQIHTMTSLTNGLFFKSSIFTEVCLPFCHSF